MNKTVVAVFDENKSAENAAKQIRDKGFSTEEISIVAKSPESTDGNLKMETTRPNDNISDGVMTGGVLGGLAGLLIGAGSMVVPGLGIIAAAGPIAGLLSGAVTGGIVGGLVDLGIPETRSKEYEEDIREGKIVFTMKINDARAVEVESILRNNGAESVQTY